jgi:hypothetical protein
MNIAELFKDKTLKSKEKTQTLAAWILKGSATTNELLEFAKASKDPVKATCIEAIEWASKENPACVNKKAFDFLSHALAEKAPRIKWESAKVIGNTAHLFVNELDAAIRNLLDNTEHSGTVVRCSAAFALGEILKLKTPHSKSLLHALKTICNNEEKNSIKKIYLAAIKKAAP